MRIPKLHYISQGAVPKDHVENIYKACSSGAKLVQLRLKNCEESELLKIAQEARTITTHFQTKLIINDHYKIAKTMQADGVHLGKTDICPTVARQHLDSWQMIGGTANTLQDCENLISKNVDYIGLGPFSHTTTKANLSPILGLKGYTTIIDSLHTKTPIIGIGGVTLKDVKDLLSTGISGIAVSGAITSNFNSITTFHQLLITSVIQEKRHIF
ncbi:MAG: thiamine phosphate synthase [Oceanihabitans sp.]|nr:thiamine phosphate synthase [Oceanihabitans sp.]